MAYKPKAPPVMATPNVIPMADIMLVLLIIFMVVTPMLTKGVSVDMASAYNPEDLPNADKDDAIVLAITHSGDFYISMGSDTSKIALSEVTGRVKDLLGSRADKTVYVRSDARAKYGDVVKVVDEARSAGVDNVGLLTQKVQLKAPAAHPPIGGSD